MQVPSVRLPRPGAAAAGPQGLLWCSIGLSPARRRCGSQAARCRTLLCRIVLCGGLFCDHLSLCTLYVRRANQYCQCCHVMGLGLWVVACEHSLYLTYRPASDPVRRRWRAARRPTAQILANLHRGTWGKGGLACPGKPFCDFLQSRKKIPLWEHRVYPASSGEALSPFVCMHITTSEPSLSRP